MLTYGQYEKLAYMLCFSNPFQNGKEGQSPKETKKC